MSVNISFTAEEGARAGALVSNGEYLACDDYTCFFFKNNFEEKIKALYGQK